MNKTISKFILIAILFFNVGFVYAVQTPKIDVATYLKMKLMGMDIMYKTLERDRKGNLTGNLTNGHGEVVDMMSMENDHILLLDNDEKVYVKFVVSKMANAEDARKSTPDRGSQELKMQAMKAQEFINSSVSAISLTGSGGVSSGTSFSASSQLSNLMAANANDFTPGEEIIYTDMRTGTLEKGSAWVSPRKGLLLDTGAPVELVFVSEQLGTTEK